MLKYRLITGPILVAVLLGLVLLDNYLDTVTLNEWWSNLFNGKPHPPKGIVLFIVGLIVAALAGVELSRIIAVQGIQSRAWLTSVAAMLGLVVSYSIPMSTGAIDTVALVATAMILVFVAAILTFSRQRNVVGVLAAAGAVMFAMVYLGLMFGFLLALRREHSAWIIVGVIALTKMCDTGAYFTGRAIGRHKLIPWLSPGKTWEGLIGGVASAGLLGILLAVVGRSILPETDHLTWWSGLICGVVFGAIGQAGDLTMSLLKRGAGVKDSGSLLPGLGGVLDVLDSPLLVAPVAYWLLQILP